ncbi:unnamed protein product [Cylicocyclus nassatus]|uniref:Pre-rRNA-processing protein TSR2 homolog n=1 Tax=Cylicocyclus nassatus TaxID=53992 RepID=A0AA36MA47_CYLNA|nr:unnamed protein product [Cylicocyclus nassatus]
MTSAINPEEWRSGPETLAKDEWFKDVLAEFILTTKGLKTEDLEDWLNNILYTEFNLILEDDSVYPTSLLLHEAFGYMKNNDRMRLEQLMNSLPSVETVREANKRSQREVDDDDDEMELDDISESDLLQCHDEDCGTSLSLYQHLLCHNFFSHQNYVSVSAGFL